MSKRPIADFFLPRHLSISPSATSAGVTFVRTLRRTVEEFFADECLQRASALAFATLLALVPVAAVSFFFLTKLEAFGEIEDKIRDFIILNLVPTRTDEVRQYLVQYTQNVRVLGIFGITALIVIAIFLFNTIETTFNAIWHVKKRRPFLGKLTSLWTVLTLTPILIGISFYAAIKLSAQSDGLLMPAWFVPYLLNIVAFWFAYQFIPYTSVRIHAAVVAAIVAGILWEIAKGGFNWYIGNVATFSQIYGSLGTIPVFLLWLYLTWVIVLLGTELAYAIQYPHGERKLTHEYLEFYSVRAMAEIARRFGERGNRRDTMDMLKDAGIPPDILGDILNALTEKNLLILTEEMEYVPARAPSAITVREVIEAVSGRKLLVPPVEKDPISQNLRKHFQLAGEQIDATLDGLDLQNLASGSAERPGGARENSEGRPSRR